MSAVTSETQNRSDVDAVDLDRLIAELRQGQPAWTGLPLRQRVGMLRDARHRVAPEVDGMLRELCHAQGLDAEGPYTGEVMAGLWVIPAVLQAYEQVLGRIASGRDPLEAPAVGTSTDGGTVVRAFPRRLPDRLLYAVWGLKIDVRMQPGTTKEQVLAEASRAYRGSGFPAPGVALVLAGGNLAFLPVTDLLQVMLGEGCVALVALNPANAFLRPYFERIFSGFVEAGWLRFTTGEPPSVRYLAQHPGVDRLHMTGSESTYDALVWGTGEEGRRRRAENTPLLDKPFTAELGGVGACIVVPGPWSASDIRLQADRICFQKLFNCGHICSATQVLVVPEGWEHTDALLDAVRGIMRDLPPRSPFYPGTAARLRRVAEEYPDAEALSAPDRRILVADLDAARPSTLVTDEVFSDVLGVVRLPMPSLREYLQAAVALVNERLPGDLAAMVLLHPDTERRSGSAVAAAINSLRVGGVGINETPNLSLVLGYGTWGAYPGNSPRHVGSGIGLVGNAFGLRGVQQSVTRGAFHPLVQPTATATHRQLGALYRALLRYYGNDEWWWLPAAFVAALRA